jgi:hypothetical protein
MKQSFIYCVTIIETIHKKEREKRENKVTPGEYHFFCRLS